MCFDRTLVPAKNRPITDDAQEVRAPQAPGRFPRRDWLGIENARPEAWSWLGTTGVERGVPEGGRAAAAAGVPSQIDTTTLPVVGIP